VQFFARFCLVVFAAAAVLSLCVPALGQTAEGWISVRTKNISIIGNASPQQMRLAVERLEQFRWAFAQLYPKLRLDNGRPTQIVMFRDAAAYFDFLPRRPDGSADVGVAGYYQAGEDRNYITFAFAERQSDPISTAVHEYVHSIIDANYDRSQLQPWLSEGLAEYFETLRFDGKKVIVGEPQIEHLRLLRRSSIIPLSEFFAINAADLKTMSQEKRRLYYAESWAMVTLLMSKGFIAVENFAENELRPGETDGSALNKFIRGDIEGSRALNVSDKFSLSDIGNPEPAADSWVSATLGDLLLHTGELARSEEYLRKSLEQDPANKFAAGSLGLALLRQNKIGDARPFLEIAVKNDSQNPLILTGYAVSLLEPIAKGGKEISDTAAREIRAILDRSIRADPAYADSYRISALLNFLRDEKLDEAIGLLQKALACKPGDPDSQILLARILLRREEAERAREIASKLANGQLDAARRTEAAEIVSNANDFIKAKATTTPAATYRTDVRLMERPTLVILKRSWLSESDVAQIDQERINNNFNRIILPAAFGEQRVVGSIDSIKCTGKDISYLVTPRTGPKISFTSPDFASVRMTVAKEGDNTFQIGCDISLASELAVINFRPAASAVNPNGSAGEVTAISFVPENFRLKTIAEMNAARPVAIDNDITRRSGPSADVTADSIQRSIAQSLRRLQKGEQRISGTIEKIDCSGDGVVYEISSGEKQIRLVQAGNEKPEIGWFTVASSQLPLTCGSGPLSANTLITYLPEERNGRTGGTIRAIEFVPAGFVP
jgi:tetratricopeptide (TPR) repeat protein